MSRSLLNGEAGQRLGCQFYATLRWMAAPFLALVTGVKKLVQIQ